MAHCQAPGTPSVHTPHMLQLSLVGEPRPPEPTQGRARIYERIYPALLAELSIAGVAPNVIHRCTEAVVDALHRQVSRLNKRQLLLRMNGNRPKCWICGYAIDLTAAVDADGEFSIDHVIPRSIGGGQLGINNLRPAHRLCNAIRGNGTVKGSKKERARYSAFLATFSQQEASITSSNTE